MDRKMLSAEERAEFDDLMYEAGHDERGNVLKSELIGPRLRQLLLAAMNAGRQWAGYFLEDYADRGCRAAWNVWNKEQNKIRVFHEGRLVPKSAMRGVKRRAADSGQTYHQQSLWDDMTVDELYELVNASHARIDAEDVTVASALRLIKAIEDTGTTTVREAMAAMSTTVAEFLACDPEAA